MPRFPSYDQTELAYHVRGAGPPLICLPGGPARASSYLGDLGGLTGGRTLILLDQRGTGHSAVPADEASYRCDRLVDDLEALRRHLDLDTMDLLAHSAGASVAQLYAARHPERLDRLVLVTPSLRAVGVEPVGADRALASRADEWWFPPARAALDAQQAAHDDPPDDTDPAELARLRLAAAPFAYGRWTEAARAHAEADAWERSEPAAAAFYAGFSADPDGVRDALRALRAPVLILAGELDSVPTPEAADRLATLYPHAEVAVRPGAAHYPWVDDPRGFAERVLAFLDR
ncbi:alpha/beta hydrolase [Micromonospora sp. NPDC049559]|uniref:alpha/beta fold hydrolase n=1 Tax=Micromonospora sp. NPDC049559 TaxID=3155923 RepID=UPI00343ED075